MSNPIKNAVEVSALEDPTCHAIYTVGREVGWSYEEMAAEMLTQLVVDKQELLDDFSQTITKFTSPMPVIGEPKLDYHCPDNT